MGTLSGLDITSMAAKSNYGTFFALLKPWEEPPGPGPPSIKLVLDEDCIDRP